MNTNLLMQWWTIATVIGWIFGGSIGFGLSYSIIATDVGRSVNLFLISSVIGGSVIGALLGFAQWVVLKSYIHNASRWILATIAGGITFGVMVCFVVVIGTGNYPPSFRLIGFALIGIITGISLGITQGLVLGRSHIRRWLNVNVVAMFCFTGTIFIGSLIASWLGAIAGLIAGAAIYGEITEKALIEILKKK